MVVQVPASAWEPSPAAATSSDPRAIGGSTMPRE
jgi:hypothetical protein